MEEAKRKIVLLLGPSRSGVFLYNYLKQYFEIQAVILERAVSRSVLIKRRAKKIGWFKVINQLFFQATVPFLLKKLTSKRYRELKAHYHLQDDPIDENLCISVRSINDEQTIKVLKSLNPSVVIINGTRIISKKVLEAVSTPFINTHTGITPAYRGVHGGYWALANADKENCGVTIHLVDKGIDTGAVLEQIKIEPDTGDNFITYPLHQLGVALPTLKLVIEQALEGKLITKQSVGNSRLWYHPTLSGYLYNWIVKGVR